MDAILNLFKYVIVFLLICVFVGLIYAAVMFYQGSDAFLTFRNAYTIETFLTRLRNGAASTPEEHGRLHKVVQALRPELVGKLPKDDDIPYDYRYFSKEVVPSFLKETSASLKTLKEDPNILQVFAPKEEYAAKLLLLSGSNDGIIRGSRTISGYAKRLEMTGTYTSSFDYPTGLFVIDGEVLNPALQTWDGLVIIDKSGKLYLKDIRRLEYNFREYDIAHSHQDYLDFLKIAKQAGLSIFQTHLLITGGAIDTSPTSERRFRRRAIFQDQQHRIAVYDSLEQEPTLYELAETLKNNYGATEAVNLDMGPYGYCARYENGARTKLYFAKGQGIRLSNILIFNYR